jgi:hypothetical protein
MIAPFIIHVITLFKGFPAQKAQTQIIHCRKKQVYYLKRAIKNYN